MDRLTLHKVAEWAEERLSTGEEPPWTFQSLRTLASISRELAVGMSLTQERVSEQGVALPQDEYPKQSGDIIQLDNFRSLQLKDETPQLPT